MTDKRELFQIFTLRFGLLNKNCCDYKSLGISLVQSHIIYEIMRQEQPSMQQIAETLGFDITTFSRQIQSLMRKGLVNKVQSKDDKRVFLLGLTDKGRAVNAEIDKKLNAYLDEVLSHLSPGEREKVLEAILLLNNAMLKSNNCCKPPF